MYARIIITLSIINIIDCNFFDAASNYLKPETAKLERNNVVNKGVWIRNHENDNLIRRASLGDFIFHPISMDVNNPAVQSTFDAFADNVLSASSFVPKYNMGRSRRSPDNIRKRRPRKGMSANKDPHSSIEDAVVINSKIMSEIKPKSVLNDYPYEVSVFLNNKTKIPNKVTTEGLKSIKVNTKEVNKTTKIPHNITSNVIEATITDKNQNETERGNDTVTRSKKYDYIPRDYEKYKMNDDYIKSDFIIETNSPERSYYRKDDRLWNNAPITNDDNNNIYKVIPKQQGKPTSKGVSEKGLVKVISMLTKTFKNIVKQHNEIKHIHKKLKNDNTEFDSKIADVYSKFEDFNSKYAGVMSFIGKVKAIESKVKNEEEFFQKKHQEIQNTFMEFENQQKNFLNQQRQFYGIQKLMLEQNEKINTKQSMIAKTQNEISLRQNNFARMLKKTKQMFFDSKFKSHISTENKGFIPATTVVPSIMPTEPVKINLFAVQTNKNNLMNHDDLIMKEKDEKQIDELVYKYYFNNTFIDNIMRTKILNNYNFQANSVAIARNAKNKRNELKTTILLPVNKIRESHSRQRRWINQFGKNKHRLNKHKKIATTNKPETTESSFIKNYHKDAFSKMAASFCQEIGQNANAQTFHWCVEKALRRLKLMNVISTSTPVTVMKEKQHQKLIPKLKRVEDNNVGNDAFATNGNAPVTNNMEVLKPAASGAGSTPLYAVTTPLQQATFFPDNDLLESNLKQYDLTPDTEGNVYYEGSVHVSDYGLLGPDKDSEGASDVMPGLLDSNSQFDVDPRAFEIQAKRRAFVEKLNDDIIKKMKYGNAKPRG